MDENSHSIVRKVAIDVVCLLFVSIPILIFYLVGKPYERGFFCDDLSLRHPYKDSTVPNWLLYMFGLGLPILAILVVELILFKSSSGQVVRTFYNRTIHPWVWNCYCKIGIFGFGAACSQLTTDIAKYTIGRLRPHFFDVCRPDIDSQCLDPAWSHRYIEHFRCMGTNPKLLKDVRLSFPSGHSSFSTYCMVYLVMYLHSRMIWNGSKLLKHLLQYVSIMLAFYTSLSRISDYKHHWSDVLAGAVQGAIVAILIVVFVSDLYPQRQQQAVDHRSSYNGPSEPIDFNSAKFEVENKESLETTKLRYPETTI